MALYTTETAEVNEVNKADAYMVDLLILIKCNFKTNLEHKLLPLVMGNNIMLRMIYVE